MNRKETEKFILSYYTKNKPKGVSLKQMKEQISNSVLADLKDEVALIKSINKKSKLNK